MLHVAETWAMTVESLNGLWCNDCAMICRIFNVKAKDEVSSDAWHLELECGAPQQDDEMVLTNRAQHRLNCGRVHAKCSCTEETQQVKGNMG